LAGYHHKGNFRIAIIGAIILFSARIVHAGFDKISITTSFKEAMGDTAKPGGRDGLAIRSLAVFIVISNSIITGLIIYANLN
jgi:hypothetical protein